LVIKVSVRSNESLEAALRRFKRQCNYSGVFKAAKARTWHEKRSDLQRRERRERLRTIQRATRLAREVASGRVQKRRPRKPTRRPGFRR
jgi:small subunit ribosomal protein S21